MAAKHLEPGSGFPACQLSGQDVEWFPRLRNEEKEIGNTANYRPDPVYSIGVAAQILNAHPRTLRIYEDQGLIKPARKGNRRYFSQNDVRWIGCLRKMIHEEGISIPGIKKLLKYAPCWEITDCLREVCEPCTAKVDQVIPRTQRIAGDKTAEQHAWEQEAAKRKQALADQPEQQPASKQKP